MFATQHYTDSMAADSPRKRGRDDESTVVPLSPSFGEHRHKRIQCLPLRSSPRQSHNAAPGAFANQDTVEPVPQSHFSPWSSSPATAQFPQDEEMDMMETLNSAPPSRLEAVRVDHEHEGSGGRMPTPIQPTFASQVRGQHNNWHQTGQSTPSLNGVVNMGHHYSTQDGYSIPRTMGEGDWHAVQQNRRLPSPISEGDDSANQLKEFAEVSISQHDAGDHEMDHPNAMMDVEPRTSTPPLDANGEPATPSPKRGHVRNMHTVNNWTWQPGMKKSFSIGYRSDCEKCRLKVPGHFNHIIVS